MKGRQLIRTAAALAFVACPMVSAAGKARIDVKAGRVLFRLSNYMTGANLEDLNYQLSGGLYSQLIHGESFEEPFGRDGVSTQWRKIQRGSARGEFARVTDGTFNGKQSQRVTFVDGKGEVGIDNGGLNGWGINLVKGKPYEGLVRVRAAPPTEFCVSLLSADGSKKYAEKLLKTKGLADQYERFKLTLTPESSDANGRFAITLTEPGSVTLGYAFLQPGPWGRYKRLPVRKDLGEAIVAQGVKVIRFNGSMIHAGGGRSYRWKKMIGPRDERPPYRGSFNPCASNGWGIIDFLDFCEAAGILPIPGLSVLETPQDLADFVEYVNGSADSEWGSKRATDGHPAPYHLKLIQLGNEEKIDAAYAERFKELADAIWSKDPKVTLVVADWMYRNGIADPHNITGARCGDLSAHVEIINWCGKRGGKIWWDVHVLESTPRAADGRAAGLIGVRHLKKHLSELAGRWDAKIAVLEQNAGNHDVARALGHAHMKNELERMGNYVPAACAPNTVQPWGQYTTKRWDQGMIFYTPSKVWFQPAYYVDRMITRNWAPNVVKAQVSSPNDALDATAKKSDDAKKLTLQVVNVEGEAITAEIRIDGFSPAEATARIEEIKGGLHDANTLEAPDKIKPVERRWRHRLEEGRTSYTFPGHSFTVLVFE
jgi:alpha-L-arabinofuranosidase